MIYLKGRSISELYPAVLSRALTGGEEVAPRGMPTLEVSPIGFELTDPRQCVVLQKARRLNYAYAVAERLCLIGGEAEPEMLCFYVSKLRDYVNPETECFDGAYGPRVRRQLGYVYEELRREPASRRALVTIYSERDQQDASLDVPCTLALHFLIRHGKLDLIVHMRSSDLFLGLPYDVNQFGFLQQVVAGWLDVEPGKYIHWADSAHIYLEHIDRVEQILSQPDEVVQAHLEVPRLTIDETFEQVALALAIERDARRRHPFRLDSQVEPRLNMLVRAFRDHVTLLGHYISRRHSGAKAPEVQEIGAKF